MAYRHGYAVFDTVRGKSLLERFFDCLIIPVAFTVLAINHGDMASPRPNNLRALRPVDPRVVIQHHDIDTGLHGLIALVLDVARYACGHS